MGFLPRVAKMIRDAGPASGALMVDHIGRPICQPLMWACGIIECEIVCQSNREIPHRLVALEIDMAVSNIKCNTG